MTIMKILLLNFSIVISVLFCNLCSESPKQDIIWKPDNFTDSSLTILQPDSFEVPIIDDSLTEQKTFEELPSPIGGLQAIQTNLNYPKEAKEAGIETSVILNVSFDEKGRIISCKVLKTIEGYGITEAAIEAVKSVPWKPAKSFGKPVPASINIPIYFRLD